jgi:hypothetical protein
MVFLTREEGADGIPQPEKMHVRRPVVCGAFVKRLPRRIDSVQTINLGEVLGPTLYRQPDMLEEARKASNRERPAAEAEAEKPVLSGATLR